MPKNHRICHFALFLLVSLTAAFSYAEPISIQLSPQESILIDGAADSPELKAYLNTLTAEERAILNVRRASILEKFAASLHKQRKKLGYLQSVQMFMYGIWASPKRHSEYAFEQMLTHVDQLLLSKAEEIANCKGWGVCSAGGMYVAVGFRKWATGLGVFYTVDYLRSFTESGTKKVRAIEFDFPKYVATKALGVELPGILGGFMYRVYIHLDTDLENSAKDLEVTYMRVAPVAVSGPNTVGYGAQTGIGLPPYLASLVQSRAKAVRVSCTQLLGAAKKVLGIKGPI